MTQDISTTEPRHGRLLIVSLFILVVLPVNITTLRAEPGAESVTIYYSLNESHGHSWVREDGQGNVGLCYFQRPEGSYSDGTLFYKTVHPDGTEILDSVTYGSRLEKSVLLYDSLDSPHIFVARSDTVNQSIDHYCLSDSGTWQAERIIDFYNEGGKFIYELSADRGPDGSFHLLILKSRSDVDSYDYWDAWLDSYLYHMTNSSGEWVNELVYAYDMAFTWDHFIKAFCRQDIKVDRDGDVHVTFSEQVAAGDYPCRLIYGNNKTGSWKFEIAMTYVFGSGDEAGWFPSLALDTGGTAYISCQYVHCYEQGSAAYSHLFLLKRWAEQSWVSTLIAENDDGYYGGDGNIFTGGLTHLVFDQNNTPHIIFSDVASYHSHYQYQMTGNIRYAVLEDSVWNLQTIYHQPVPIKFLDCTEMHDMCLIVSEQTGMIRVIGQEMITKETEYNTSLVSFQWPMYPTDVDDTDQPVFPERYLLSQNYPNPFNPSTRLDFNLPQSSRVTLTVYNLLGRKVTTLVDRQLPPGQHSVNWDGTDSRGRTLPTGVYLYRLQAGNYSETRKMVLLK